MNRNYDDPQYKAARLVALKRDKYRCRVCRSKDRICEHHLDGWDSFPSLRCEPKNLITLCGGCHKNFHDLYGKGGNTIYQFDQYLNFYHRTSLAEIMKDPPKRKRK